MNQTVSPRFASIFEKFPPVSPTDPIQVFIVDDHPAIREALSSAIEKTKGMKVIGVGATVSETLRFVKESIPDVVIADISLEEGDGLTLIERLRSEVPDTRILVYSMYNEDVYAERALRAGAQGYISKSASSERVIDAVQTVNQGDVYLSEFVSSQLLSKIIRRKNYSVTPIEQLTDRELTVFRMLGEGNSVRDIADQLDLSRKTIETYRRRAKEKLGYDTVDELLRHAVQWIGGQEHGLEEGSGDAS